MKKSPREMTVKEFLERYRRPLKGISQAAEKLEELSAGTGRPPEGWLPTLVDSGPERADASWAAGFEENGGQPDLHAAAELYREATGEAPHEIVALKRGYLFETGVVGDYDQCPNGYLPLFLCRTPGGWIVFDNGHSTRGDGPVPRPLSRDGDILYLEAAAGPSEVRFAIGTMVRYLRELNEGR